MALVSREAEHTIRAFADARLDLSHFIRLLPHTPMMRVRVAMFDAQSKCCLPDAEYLNSGALRKM